MELDMTKLKKDLQLSYSIASYSPEKLAELTNCYNKLAEGIDSADDSYIIHNKEVYDTILNRNVVFTAVNMHKNGMMTGLSESAKAMFEPSNPKFVLTLLRNNSIKDIAPYSSIESSSKIDEALSIFGIPEVNQNISGDILDNDGFEFADEDFFNNTDSETEETEEITTGEDSDILDAMNEINGENEEPTEVDTEQTYESEPIQISASMQETSPVEQEISNEQYDKQFGARIKEVVNSLLDTYDSLYKSGFESMAQAGIMALQNSADIGATPIVAVKSDNGRYRIKYTVDRAISYDQDICTVITKMIPSLGNYHSDTKITSLSSGLGVCHKLHIGFQSANFDINSNSNISIRKWYSATHKDMPFDEWTKKVNKNSVRISSYKDVRSWYEWSLKQIIYEALRDSKLSCDNSIETNNKFTAILDIVASNLKNIIVVSERNIGISEELRISSASSIDKEALVSKLTQVLNTSNDATVKVKLTNKDSTDNKTTTIRIIYDAKEDAKSTVFAGTMIETLKNNGALPTWDHCLMGKRDDGSYFFWDKFESEPGTAPSRSYAIYAGTGAGKGIMTSTLLTAALSSEKQVFYTDGKPESGACIGEVAWSRGYEAYVFNGTKTGAAPYEGSMESYTLGKRSKEEIYAFTEKLPETLFNDAYVSKDDLYTFLGVMRYLKSMLLCSYIINNRAARKLEVDKWQVWVFDEMTKMSSNEGKIRKIFNDYCKDNGISTKATKDGTLINIVKNEKYIKAVDGPNKDAGMVYIAKWLEMASEIVRQFKSASVIELRKASADLIFIFQQPTWLLEEHEVTTIAKVVWQLQCTKIVGCGGLVKGCQVYGDDTMGGYEVERIKENSGWWGISNSIDVRKGFTLFKPFSVWTKPRTNEPFKIDENGYNHKLDYVDGYVSEILEFKGLNPGEVLQSAYDYADSAVKKLGISSDLKSFIYNCVDLKTSGGGYSLKNITDAGINGGVADSGASVKVQSGASFYDSDDEEYIPGLGASAPVNTGSATPVKDDASTVRNRNIYDELNRQRTQQAQAPVTPVINQAPVSPIHQNTKPDYIDEIEDEEYIDDTDEIIETTEHGYNPLRPSVDRESPDTHNYGHVRNSEPMPEIIRNTGGEPDIRMNNGLTTFKSNEVITNNLLGLNNDNSVQVTVSGYKKPSAMRKMLQFANTANFELRDRWNYILSEVKRSQGSNTITKVTITRDSLVFNNKIINTVGILGGEDGVMLEDIVNFRELAKEFKTIKRLNIDEVILEQADNEFNSEPIYSLFSIMPNLMKITTLGCYHGGADETIDRRQYNNYKEQLAEQHKRAKQKEQIDIISDSYNNKRSESGLEQARRQRKLDNNTGDGWSKCKSKFNSNKPVSSLFRVAGYTVFWAIPKSIFRGIKSFKNS